VSGVAPLPHDDEDGPAFDEPWHADVHALSRVLVESGLVTGAEWMNALAEAITAHQKAGDPDLGDTYYDHCLTALEVLCEAKGLTATDDITERAEQWRRAYLNTPHGQPVELTAGERSHNGG
jgi:nitrile hydratase accessory protein